MPSRRSSRRSARPSMAEPRRLSSREAGFEEALKGLLAFESAQDESVDRATAEILDAVRARGDAALLEYTARFDRWNPAGAADLEIPRAQAARALSALPHVERDALEHAAARIRSYHERQRQESWRTEEADGTVL